MSDSESKRDEKAKAAAEKAGAKASRPWYDKKRFILPLAILIMIVAFAIRTGGDWALGLTEDEGTADPGNEEEAATEEAPEEAPE